MTITNILLTLVVLVIAGAGIYYFIKNKKEAPQEKEINVAKIEELLKQIILSY